MPSLFARGFAAVLRYTGTVSNRFSGGPLMHRVIEAARAQPVPEPTAKMRRVLDVRVSEWAGRPVWHLAPRDRTPAAHLLYYHGGGYIFTAMPPHWSSLAALVRDHDIAVTAPLYPLAPESGAEGTTSWALDHYRQFLDEVPGPFVLGGDSAGGGLASATAMGVRDSALRMPAGLLLICPWLDVTVSHPEQPAIEPRDAILRIRGIRDAGTLYRRDLSVDDWRVSPLHGNWEGLPPIMMFGGGDDILVTDARALAAKRPDAHYDERAGLIHDWPLFFFSESRDARRKMGAWIVDRCRH